MMVSLGIISTVAHITMTHIYSLSGSGQRLQMKATIHSGMRTRLLRPSVPCSPTTKQQYRCFLLTLLPWESLNTLNSPSRPSMYKSTMQGLLFQGEQNITTSRQDGDDGCGGQMNAGWGKIIYGTRSVVQLLAAVWIF